MSTAYFELHQGEGSAYVIETDDARIWADDPKATRISRAKGQAALKAEAFKHLAEIIKPGDTIYTSVTHISRSGMSRNIQAFVIRDNQPQNVSGWVARVIDHPCDRGEMSVKMGGCGMDMGFALVYALSSALFRDGFSCIGEGKAHGERCPSNDHSNGDRDYKPHTHRDGGYALRHRWL